MKNDDAGHPDAPGLPGTKPSTKGYTWFQPKEWQRNALLDISGRRGPWSCECSIDAPVWENQWVGWRSIVLEAGYGRMGWGFSEVWKPGRGITFEM